VKLMTVVHVAENVTDPQSEFGDRLALKQYLAGKHVVITTISSAQNIPDKQHTVLGVKRRSSVSYALFGHCLWFSSCHDLTLTQ
jgi:hypothetical protein